MTDTARDPIGQATGLTRIGAELVRAVEADPLLTDRLPRRVLDALDLHYCQPAEPAEPAERRDVPLGRVLSYMRGPA